MTDDPNAAIAQAPLLRVEFRDTNKALCEALAQAVFQATVDGWFGLGKPTAPSIWCGSIFASPANFVVSPANSFGFMDGGIDAVYTDRFGIKVQNALQANIQQRGGELLIGQTITVATGDADFPYLVASPTMRVPMRIVDPFVVRLATRAAIVGAMFTLRHIAQTSGPIDNPVIVIPGMGTGTGGVPLDLAAKLMVQGVIDAFSPRPFPTSWPEAQDDHFKFYEDRQP
jgi:O-acetyl-ADP-ribose deacetylase (regulator of RNase III)